MARTAHRETGLENLCLAGGVALNCVANGRILREGPFKRLWIQPAAGDAGGALGAAQLAWHRHLKAPRRLQPGRDAMHGRVRWARCSRATEIESWLGSVPAPYTALERPELNRAVARDARGWQGRRMVRRPHGVRPARTRAAQHPRRSAESAHAGRHEHQDQVPRGIPALRPQRPAGEGERLLRARLRLALHAARGTGAAGAAHRRRRGTAGSVGHRQAQPAAIRHSRGHAHRLFGAHSDGLT